MAILTFDPTSAVTSNKFRYFDEILRRGTHYGARSSFEGTLYSYLTAETYPGDFHSRLSGFATVPPSSSGAPSVTGGPSISLASVFDSPARIKEATTWRFSARSEYLDFGYFDLYDQDSRLYVAHTYEGDVFSLGAGSDYFRIKIDFNMSDASSSAYGDAEDEALDGGYHFGVDAGAGADRIIVNYSPSGSDYTCDKFTDGEWNLKAVVPVVSISGGAGNDRVAVSGIAGILAGDAGTDILSGSVFSDWISGGLGNDVINGSPDVEGFGSAEMYNQGLAQKDLLSGGLGTDTFLIGSIDSYGLNGASDFFVITDLDRFDRIASPFKRGNLLIEGTDGMLSLEATSAYAAQTLKYTARLYLDSDDSGKVSSDDELLGYICGFQPTPAHLVYGI